MSPWKGHGMTLANTALECLMDLTLKFTAMPFGESKMHQRFFLELMIRVAREDDRGVIEGREDVREVFQQCTSSKRGSLTRLWKDKMGNEPILALPEGADDFVVYYDVRSNDLEACLEKGRRYLLVLLEAIKERDMEKNVKDHGLLKGGVYTKYYNPSWSGYEGVVFRINRIMAGMKKDVASCGSKYLAYSRVKVEYQGSLGLLLQPELPE
ncbi:hypothetical protein Tco_0127545 [Tanacetum coccineum]